MTAIVRCCLKAPPQLCLKRFIRHKIRIHGSRHFRKRSGRRNATCKGKLIQIHIAVHLIPVPYFTVHARGSVRSENASTAKLSVMPAI